MKSSWNVQMSGRSESETRRRHLLWRRIILIITAVITIVGAVDESRAALSGAVFTTNSTGTQVDGNIYVSKDDVYLNGGPQAQNGAAGLPDGSYYVKVTEPNGTLLGTSVPVAAVQVLNGEFAALYQLSLIAPYADTSNPGGEYKVWVSKDINFINSQSKTDNFKVRSVTPPPTPEGRLIVR